MYSQGESRGEWKVEKNGGMKKDYTRKRREGQKMKGFNCRQELLSAIDGASKGNIERNTCSRKR